MNALRFLCSALLRRVVVCTHSPLRRPCTVIAGSPAQVSDLMLRFPVCPAAREKAKVSSMAKSKNKADVLQQQIQGITNPLQGEIETSWLPELSRATDHVRQD